MRTTLDIEDDVLQAAKELARRDGSTASSEPSEQAQRSIGVGMAQCATPPSKPDGRISRIRLSSQWVSCEGERLFALIPKDDLRTFGIQQGFYPCCMPPLVSPCRHSRWFVVRHSGLHPSTFLRPFAPRSLPASQLLRTL